MKDAIPIIFCTVDRPNIKFAASCPRLWREADRVHRPATCAVHGTLRPTPGSSARGLGVSPHRVPPEQRNIALLGHWDGCFRPWDYYYLSHYVLKHFIIIIHSFNSPQLDISLLSERRVWTYHRGVYFTFALFLYFNDMMINTKSFIHIFILSCVVFLTPKGWTEAVSLCFLNPSLHGISNI